MPAALIILIVSSLFALVFSVLFLASVGGGRVHFPIFEIGKSRSPAIFRIIQTYLKVLIVGALIVAFGAALDLYFNGSEALWNWISSS